MFRFSSLVVLNALLLASAAAAEPKPIVLDQGGRKVVFYRVGDVQYREIRSEDLARVQSAAPVCLIAKLMDADDKGLRLHGAEFQAAAFSFEPGVTVGLPPGSNVWLGGTVKTDGGKILMRIKAVEPMPSDLVLFDGAWKSLTARADATPEDCYRLAWRLSQGKTLAMGLTPEELEAYDAKIRQAVREGLRRETEGLADAKDAALAAHGARFRAFVDGFADVAADGDADWLLTSYRAFLHDHAAALTALADKKPPEPAARRRLLAALHALAGRTALRFLDDKAEATRLFLAAAAIQPDLPDLAEELGALGYERVGERWLSAAEAARVKGEKKREVRAAELRREQAVAAKAQEAARNRLQGGEGLEKTFTVVDPLLSRLTGENIQDLIAALKDLPQDVARQALWAASTAADPAVATAPALAALNLDDPVLRADAADILAADGRPVSVTALATRLGKEKDAETGARMVDSLRAIPGAGGIDALLKALSTAGLSPAAKMRISETLMKETGQKFGVDLFNWQEWWQKNRGTFKRADPTPES